MLVDAAPAHGSKDNDMKYICSALPAALALTMAGCGSSSYHYHPGEGPTACNRDPQCVKAREADERPVGGTEPGKTPNSANPEQNLQPGEETNACANPKRCNEITRESERKAQAEARRIEAEDRRLERAGR
jgi:hypothetical protein